MGDRTGIAWTEATWNPLAGCTRVSRGCDNCYAAQLAATRLKHTRQYGGLATITPSGRAAFNGQINLLHERLDQPLRWRKPRMVFVNSQSDLFHEHVPYAFIDQVFAVMAAASQHTFQVLTKRPERMRDYMRVGVANRIERAFLRLPRQWNPAEVDRIRAMPLPNVWLGVSAEDQEAADERIPLLLETPAAVRWVSAEPLLGPIDLTRIKWARIETGRPEMGEVWSLANVLHRRPADELNAAKVGLDWLVVGGESGRQHRPMDLDWLWRIVQDCQGADVPVFVKQDSHLRAGQRGRIPDDLWAQEWPNVAVVQK